MVEFKVVVNDIKNGKSHQVQVSGHHANSLIGKKIGDEVDGIFISLPGYKLKVTGGTDKNGFAMRISVATAMNLSYKSHIVNFLKVYDIFNFLN